MDASYDLTLIRNTLETEDGTEVTTYGVSYVSNGRTITLRHLSTKRSEVEFFISALINGGGSLSLMDDLIEDFVS